MRRLYNDCVIVAAFVLLLLNPTTSARAAEDRQPRAPLGVYAHISIEDAIRDDEGSPIPPVAPDVRRDLRRVYRGLLDDPAISGITAGIHWDHIEFADPFCMYDRTCAAGSDGFDWSLVDDLFIEANAAHKTIQLIVTPGVDAPQWLLDRLPPCDGLFGDPGTAPADCGKVTFDNFPEQKRADSVTQPLPWDWRYVLAWDNFLVHLSSRYAHDPAWVSVAVAGPNCASTEMIFPTSAKLAVQASGLDADSAWDVVIRHSFPGVARYARTDEAFVDAWKQTIDAYERIFSGITLFISPDAANDWPEPSGPATSNALSAIDCSAAKANPVACAAKAEVISYFVDARGPNAKSTQVGGLTASSSTTPGNIGIAGVKVVTSLFPGMLGGADFDLSVSDPKTMVQQGCPDYPNQAKCSSAAWTAEDATYNTLTVFFDGSRVASDFGGQQGTAPIQYVGIDYQDVQFAQQETCPTPTNSVPGQLSVQDLLNLAHRDLFELNGRRALLPPRACQRR